MPAASCSNSGAAEHRREPGVRLVDRSGERQQDVVPAAFEGSVRVLVGIPPGVVDVQRCPVVDQPGPAVPDEEIGVARRPVGIGRERVEPDDRRGVPRIDLRRGARVERQGPRQEVEAQVQAAAAMDEILELLVGLGVAEAAVDLDRDEFGDRKPERPTDLTGQPLRDERARTLACGAELHDVQPVIVGLDQARQRATLAQGRDIAGGGHVARSGHAPESSAPRPVQVRNGLRVLRHVCGYSCGIS